MAIDKLRKLIPPPAEPVETGNKTKWAEVEKQLGTKLPDDFKSLIDLYGSGSMCGFYGLFNPFNSDSSGNLLHRFKDYSKILAAGHADDPENYPYPPFPELPGLIPWANDTNGNTYYWLVKAKAKPNDWTVAIDECGEGFSEFAGGLTDYLVAVFKGKVDALAGNFPEPGDLRFVQKAVLSPLTAELSKAIMARNVKAMRKLIAAGADVNAINDTNSTLLFDAAGFSGAIEPVKLLVAAGADVNGVSEEGTPLFSTVYNSEPEKAKYLLSVGADPNAKNHRGDTPLFAAIHNGRTEMIELLAAVPGTLAITNKAKLTPLALAKKKKDNRIVEILEKASGKKPRPAKVAVVPKAVASPPSMQTILKLLPPPAVPKHVGTDGGSRMAERQFHTAFPADWRDFCRAYGGYGSLDPIGLVIVNPFNKGEWPWVKGRLNWFRREWTKANDPAKYPYAVFPEPGGLFPFAAINPGKEIFYRTEGNPDDWPIVILEEESRRWHEHKLSLTGLLTALLQGKAVAPFKKDWIKQLKSPLKFVD